ncbi:DUF2771 domain-containing protein [Streptomyces sp. NPDC047022]|uniref:DUF2771 domain-containing protein n=1 Tax=Streptomyces sp. NPDC047022 TaxID=3155737 RepID=UPI00340AED05
MTALRSRRAVAAFGAVSAGLLLLSACNKPTPLATVTVGTNSVSTQTACYNDGKVVPPADLAKCLTAKDMKSIKVASDDTVRFGVDPSIADKGWTILLNGQPLTESSKETYRTIPGSVFFNSQYGASGNATTVSIKQGENNVTGLWSFKFEKKS